MYYNGKRLAIKNFQDYVALYLGPKDTGAPRVYERCGDRWEVVVSPTDGQFQQVRGRGRAGCERVCADWADAPLGCCRSAL